MNGLTPNMAQLYQAVEKRRELTTVEAASISDYSSDHICLLLRRGLLEGAKRGRDWFVNAESLERYVKSNPQPGRRKA